MIAEVRRLSSILCDSCSAELNTCVEQNRFRFGAVDISLLGCHKKLTTVWLLPSQPLTMYPTYTYTVPGPIHMYMLLSAVGYERGQPIGFFFDPFRAMAAFDQYNDLCHAFGAGRTVFLVAYQAMPDGTLIELEEIGRK